MGTWKLRSFITEHLVTGEKTTLFGTHPVGYLSCSAGGGMYAIFGAHGRKAIADLVPTDAESVHLYNGFSACAGTIRVQCATVNHAVDASWNETWTGTTQVRRFRIEGEN